MSASGPSFPAGTRPERIHITGGPGSGKTSLSRLVAEELGVTPWHLDDVAHVAGGNTAETPREERLDAVERIVGAPRWVTEGIDLDWTEGLLLASDLIVWLDTVSWPLATRRIVRRFVSNALAEARRRKGAERVTRFRDYARHTVELIRSVPDTRSYYGQASAGGGTMGAVSRKATQAALAPYRAKVLHCRTMGDLSELLRALRADAGSSQYPQSPDTSRPRSSSRRSTSGRNSA